MLGRLTLTLDLGQTDRLPRKGSQLSFILPNADSENRGLRLKTAQGYALFGKPAAQVRYALHRRAVAVGAYGHRFFQVLLRERGYTAVQLRNFRAQRLNVLGHRSGIAKRRVAQVYRLQAAT